MFQAEPMSFGRDRAIRFQRGQLSHCQQQHTLWHAARLNTETPPISGRHLALAYPGAHRMFVGHCRDVCSVCAVLEDSLYELFPAAPATEATLAPPLGPELRGPPEPPGGGADVRPRPLPDDFPIVLETCEDAARKTM